MGIVTKPYRVLKICCIVTAILLIILVLIGVILYFTLLKPKQPTITTQSVTLEQVRLSIGIPIHVNVSLGMVFTIDNPNYGSFKYENSTTFVTYRGEGVAEAAVPHDTLPARGNVNVSTVFEVFGDKFVLNPNFLPDYLSGCFNFTSKTRLHGKVSVWKIFKTTATSFSTCDISVFFLTKNATSVCTANVKY